MEPHNGAMSETCRGILDFGIFNHGTLALTRKKRVGMGPQKILWKLPGGWRGKNEKSKDAIRRVIFQTLGVWLTPTTQEPFTTEVIQKTAKSYRFSVWVMDVSHITQKQLQKVEHSEEIKLFTLSELFEELKLDKNENLRRSNIAHHHNEHILTYLNTKFTP